MAGYFAVTTDLGLSAGSHVYDVICVITKDGLLKSHPDIVEILFNDSSYLYFNTLSLTSLSKPELETFVEVSMSCMLEFVVKVNSGELESNFSEAIITTWKNLHECIHNAIKNV